MMREGVKSERIVAGRASIAGACLGGSYSNWVPERFLHRRNNVVVVVVVMALREEGKAAMVVEAWIDCV
jgi:hypothetical protein